MHLTHSSSTVIEAAQFGLQSVLTSPYGAELFGPLIASGMAQLQTGDVPVLASTLARLAATGSRQRESAPPVGATLDRLLADAAPVSGQRTA